jgi:very-short-patch-repair endonuclease
LRRSQTPAERRLSKLLRKLDGFHFRQQTAVGPHVFDFADLGRNLLIELDGGIHRLAAVQERDAIKQAWAEARGYVVVRIPNEYVFGSGEPAIAMVLEASRRLARDRTG